MIVEWRADDPLPSRRPVSFVAGGYAELEPGAVERAFTEFVDLILERARDLDHPDLSALRADWMAITATTKAELELCKRAAQMGLDAYDCDQVSPNLEVVLMGELDKLPPPTRGDLLDAAVRTAFLASSVSLLADEVTASGLEAGVPGASLPRPSGNGRAHGYALARAVRSHIGQPAEPLDWDAALGSLGCEGLHASRAQWTPLHTNLKAAIGFSQGSPRLLTRPAKLRSERFLVARGLFALLSHATSNGPRLITSAGTRLQAASRAFAAELLAPSVAIRARIRDGLDEDRIDEIAEEFMVAPTVIEHQVANHRLLPD